MRTIYLDDRLQSSLDNHACPLSLLYLHDSIRSRRLVISPRVLTSPQRVHHACPKTTRYWESILRPVQSYISSYQNIREARRFDPLSALERIAPRLDGKRCRREERS
ncbi:hypothetical protein RSOL_239510 [Rhizoctonia solani AG-3 Rhs1AP]|uniref:Uncharacterized protein n=2 Tax=Rhizoctonia solani AG-3 TaxID=1086053 RepID=A0A074S337_9AGAM|nr:hypothetical protein RSOL_239510 [Rhizoctonia solani AG-3 Rhs1AP]KEP51273.1 hypothetical protein V565_064690 [Rhizoctonia solani 123E]